MVLLIALVNVLEAIAKPLKTVISYLHYVYSIVCIYVL